MQGVAFLDKGLFSAYSLNLPLSDDEEAVDLPNFQISLASFLEVLQIFGAVDCSDSGAEGRARPLSDEAGDAFKITIEEAGVKTTAGLTTYVPELPDDIPFNREEMSFKIIMSSRSLLDCLAEISPTAPDKLAIMASKTSPFLSLAGSGDLGSSAVDFARGRDLLETFTIADRWAQTYKFDFIKNSTEAMRIANKFMVEMEGGKRSFLDFRFVPFITYDEEDEDENGTGVGFEED
ncbi:checkpoint clamp complex protein Rad1 [Metarhizium acridum]|nr:checkpoint clamp complex protein Rad1 [Metarhizium acridum]